jgi:hypothetical protein
MTKKIWKTCESKSLAEIFCEAFLDFTQIFCLNHPRLISVLKNGSFGSPAVRIRQLKSNYKYFEKAALM